MDKRDIEIEIIELTKRAAKDGVSQQDIVEAIKSVLNLEGGILRHRRAMEATY